MLYLHIGMPKAGSTTIQKFLGEFESDIPHRQLQCFGGVNAWKIAAASGTPAAHWYFVEHTKQLSEQEFASLPAEMWSELSAELGLNDAKARDYVISSEYIFMWVAKDKPAIRNLRDKLEATFGEVKIILYLRGQVDFVKSMYAQLVKGKSRFTVPFPDFIAKLDEIEISRHYVPTNYAEIVEAWAECFGPGNVDVAVFDRENFPDNSLIQDFCQRANLVYDPAWRKDGGLTENKSPEYSQLEVLRFFNAIGLKKGRLRRYAARALKLILPERDFPQEYDRAIQSKVSATNKRLNEGLFSGSAAKLPEN